MKKIYINPNAIIENLDVKDVLTLSIDEGTPGYGQDNIIIQFD